MKEGHVFKVISILILMVGLVLCDNTIFCQPASAADLWVNSLWSDSSIIPAHLESGISAFTTVTDAVAASKKGDTVWIYPGRYDQNGEQFPIIINRPISICSVEGARETFISAPPHVSVFEICAPGTEIRGLTIEHKGSGLVIEADDVCITENRILLSSTDYRVTSCGVWLAGVCRNRIIKNEFIDCGLAIVGPPINDGTGDNAVLTGLFEVGEKIEWFTTHIVEDNRVNGHQLVYVVDQRDTKITQDAGQIILANCENLTIQDVRVCDASIGIQIAHSKGIKLINCQACNNGLFGFYVVYSDDCFISDSLLLDNSHGLDLRNSTNNKFRFLQVQGNNQGIFLANSSTNLISKSRISKNHVGAYIGDSLYNKLLDSEIIENDLGIYVRKAGSTFISGNYISRNKQSGIRLSKASNNSIVEQNIIEGNKTGILVLNSGHIFFKQNEVKQSDITGLYLYDSVCTYITKSFFEENNVAIKIVEKAQNTTIYMNSFYGNAFTIQNEADEPVDARENWWGTIEESSIVSHLEGPVQFIPWLEKPPYFSDEASCEVFVGNG